MFVKYNREKCQIPMHMEERRQKTNQPHVCIANDSGCCQEISNVSSMRDTVPKADAKYKNEIKNIINLRKEKITI